MKGHYNTFIIGQTRTFHLSQGWKMKESLRQKRIITAHKVVHWAYTLSNASMIFPSNKKKSNSLQNFYLVSELLHAQFEIKRCGSFLWKNDMECESAEQVKECSYLEWNEIPWILKNKLKITWIIYKNDGHTSANF